ncbi:hypothetical protein F5Y03DRAFT_342503 [Xylaria venustula]|nr:hypothetical protein F5Y03DRAFT_342503 [Xylaria venustula]
MALDEQSSPIERLPLELLQMILSALPDVVLLQTAVLSCPLFYRSFLEAESAIVTQVLFNQLDMTLLPEAIATAESACLRPHDTDPKSREAIIEFVTRNLHQRSTLPGSWSLTKALHIGRFHFHVQAFTDMFINTTFARIPRVQSDSVATRTATRAATRQERKRVECALYRFEIYCNLFRESRNAESPIYEEQRQLFFQNFAPWENEQLGCIHDFLFEVIAPIFNDILEGNSFWKEIPVRRATDVGDHHVQHIMSFGLKKLHDITESKSFEETCRLLTQNVLPPISLSFLYEGFHYAKTSNSGVSLNDSLTPEDKARFIRSPFFADPDSGPEDVWRWAHQDEICWYWVYTEDRRDLRQWGYVMWDKSRLEAVGIFQEPWTDEVDSSNSSLESPEAEPQPEY